MMANKRVGGMAVGIDGERFHHRSIRRRWGRGKRTDWVRGTILQHTDVVIWIGCSGGARIACQSVFGDGNLAWFERGRHQTRGEGQERQDDGCVESFHVEGMRRWAKGWCRDRLGVALRCQNAASVTGAEARERDCII